MGTALSNALLNKGYKVIILTRKPNKISGEKNKTFALWDVKKQEIDIEAVKKADYIIHLAGAGVVDKKWTTAYKKEIIESRTESSRLIVTSLTNSTNKVKAVISASAIGYYGPDKSPDRAFVENDKADKCFLGETCRLWEESIEPVNESGIRLIKFRIGIVLSNDGGALAEFKKPLRFGLAAILGIGRQIVSWIHIDDLCRLFINAMEDEKIKGTFNAVAPEPVSNKTLTLSLAKIQNRKFYVPFYVPAFILKLMMGQRSIEVLKSATVSCKKIQETGFTFEYDTVNPALTDLLKK